MNGVVKRDPRLDIFYQAFDAEERGDIKRAIWLYRLVARKGWANAWTSLGDIFAEVVTPKRPREAVKCYMRAIKKREVSGANNLAVHYRLANNHRLYMYWIKKAAAWGDEDCVRELAKIRLTRARWGRFYPPDARRPLDDETRG